MAAAPAPVARKPSAPKPKKKDVFSLVDFVNERDWVGAVTLLEVGNCILTTLLHFLSLTRRPMNQKNILQNGCHIAFFT